MQKKLILRTQANDVFNIIQELGLVPSDFEWQEHDSESSDGDYYKVSKLIHKPTGYNFIFDYDYDQHFAIRSPGKDSVVESRSTDYWSRQLGYASEWLQLLKREIDAPDLWGAIAQESELVEIAIANETSNTPFTNDEQKHLVSQIKEIENYSKASFNLSKEQLKFISLRLDYLKESAKRQGRRDWLHTVIGILVTIIVGVGLAPEQAGELFRFAANILKHVLKGTLPAL